MKIALFCHAFPLASETFVSNHVVALMKAGMDVSVITESVGDAWANIPEPLRETVRARTVLIDPAMMAGWRQSISALPATGLLRAKIGHWLSKALRRRSPALGRYDAILAHFGTSGVAAMTLRRQGYLQGPIATIFHGFDMSVTATVARLLPHYRQLFRETEALLPISRAWAERLEAWGADPAKIAVLHMGVDLPQLSVDCDRPLASPLRVIQVGRQVEKKGGRYAIEGVSRCPSPVTLDMIGGGDLEPDLRAMAEAIGSANPIRFRGAMTHEDVLASLDCADVFLLPSVTAENGDMEGIPVALMEAMLHGCIVLSTQHSGIPELVEDGVSGVLVPERSADAIAQALDAIARGAYDLPCMRRNAIATVDSQFSNVRLNAQLVALLGRMTRGEAIS